MVNEELKQVLADAIAHSNHHDDRVRFLEKRCGANKTLLDTALSLIGYASDHDTHVQIARTISLTESQTEAASLAPGAHVSDYRLVSPIGRGASGTVWLAVQEIFGREVALKILVHGIGDPVFTERFLMEQKILASMAHPNIAQVYDAGMTSDGRPYYAMELVSGHTLEEHCDSRRLTIRDRLTLIARVCRAVHHAHQRGVIHRDLKPSNILCQVDDEGTSQPKVIDFGIARENDPKAPANSTNVIEGTLHYMSPEQTRPSHDVSVTTDVYSIGVITYEILAGARPLERLIKPSRRIQSNLEAIQNGAVPSMSDVLPRPGPKLAHRAACRRTNPQTLQNALEGELEWIVRRAMAKDSADRYDSAESLALDIERYLGGHAVQAVPPSRRYRVRKFVRRHRAPIAALSTLVAVLIAGVVTSTMLYVEAEHARASVAERLRTSRLLSAELSLQADDVSGARSALESVEPEHRGWLWNVLARRTDSSHEQYHWPRTPIETRVREGEQVEVLLDDGSVHVWDAGATTSHEDRKRISGGAGQIVMGSTGGWLAYTDQATELYVLERNSSSPTRLVSLRQSIATLTVSPRGSSVLVSEFGGRLIDVHVFTGETVVLVHPDASGAASNTSGVWYHDVAISRDGSTVAVATNTNVIRIVDRGTRRLRDEFTVDAAPSCLSFDAEGDWLAIGGRDGVIRVRSLSSERIDSFIAHSAAVLAMTFADVEGRPTLFSGDEDGRIGAFDQVSWDKIGEAFGHDAPITSLEAAPDLGRLVSASADGSTRTWPLDLRVSRSVPLARSGEYLLLTSTPHSAVLAAGSEIAVAHSPWRSDPTVIGSDAESVTRALLVHRGDWVVVARDGGAVEALPTREGLNRRVLATDVEDVWTMTGSESWVAVGNDFGQVRWWNLAGRGNGRIESLGIPVGALAFDRNRRRIAVGRADGTIIILDVNSGTEIVTIQAHPRQAISALCFAASGPDLLYSAARGKMGHVDPIRGWSLPGGLPESDLGHPETSVEFLLCHPGEGWILAAERRAVVRIFDPESSGLITLLRPAGKLLEHAALDPVDGSLCTISEGGVVDIW